MLNKVILKGILGCNPEIKKTQDGRDIAMFSLGTLVTWKDAKNEWQTHTTWHRVIVFKESTVLWIRDIVKKGATVYVEGKLANHSYVGKDGQKRITTHVAVSGWEGKVEFLRSGRSPQEQESDSQTLVPESEEHSTNPDLEDTPQNEDLSPHHEKDKSQKNTLPTYFQ